MKKDFTGYGFLRTVPILLIVLIAGYLVMSLEILGFRVVQVHFGSSIFSTGALLGVVLTALTLGYWIGGTLSIRFHPSVIQSLSLIFAGIWIFLLAGVPSDFADLFMSRDDPLVRTEYVIDPLWKTIPDAVFDWPLGKSIETRLRIDPLFGSLVLFFIPSMLLATVGPCAAHTLTYKREIAGKISGWVFALGSLGSIAGVVITSFWLISIFGLGTNFRLIGVVGVLIGFLAVITGRWYRPSVVSGKLSKAGSETP